jgi:hypothetical protein
VLPALNKGQLAEKASTQHLTSKEAVFGFMQPGVNNCVRANFQRLVRARKYQTAGSCAQTSNGWSVRANSNGWFARVHTFNGWFVRAFLQQLVRACEPLSADLRNAWA